MNNKYFVLVILLYYNPKKLLSPIKVIQILNFPLNYASMRFACCLCVSFGELITFNLGLCIFYVQIKWIF